MYSSAEECKKHPEVFGDLAKYNDFYHVLTEWPAVERLLETRAFPTSPATQTKAAVRATLYYMFWKYYQCFYVSIRDRKLNLVYLFNEHWTNPLADKIRLPKRWRHRNPDDVIDLGSVVRLNSRPRDDQYTMDFTYFKLKHVLEVLLAEQPIRDCDFVIAGRDRLNLKVDRTEASEELVGSTTAPLPAKFTFPEYAPVFSFCRSDRFADIAWPTPMDWQRVFKGYYTNECTNHYLELPPVEWSKKKPVAVFRGSYTGMWADERNPRIRVTVLNTRWAAESLLDAGISDWKGKWRGRKDIHSKEIAFVDPKYEQMTVAPLNHQEQQEYKYVLYIEGNVAAYRGAFLFSWRSVVLWVRPAKYELWFESLLKHRVNCVFVKHDLSDLKEQLLWLRANDDAARAIAEEGYRFYREHLTREPILRYMADTLHQIASKG